MLLEPFGLVSLKEWDASRLGILIIGGIRMEIIQVFGILFALFALSRVILQIKNRIYFNI